MTIAIILVLAGFLSLAAMLFLAKNRPMRSQNLSELKARISSIDIAAFRNLTDPAEEDFLRMHLSPGEFRIVQRERLRAVIEYVSLVSRNAAILHRIGDSARSSPNPSVSAAGEKLVNSALRFRIYAFHVLARLYLALLMPSPSIHPFLGIADGYQDMNSLVVVLNCMQQGGLRVSNGAIAQVS